MTTTSRRNARAREGRRRRPAADRLAELPGAILSSRHARSARPGRDRHRRRPGHRARARAAARRAGRQGRRQRPRRRGTAAGARAGPAQSVVDEIRAPAARRSPTATTSSTWSGAERARRHRDRRLRRPRRARQQRRHPARPDARQHDRGGVGRGHPRAPEGHVRARPAARPRTGGSARRRASAVDARIINTTSVVGPLRQRRARRTTAPPRSGIAAFTIIAAQELGRYGVTVNAIAPRALHPHDRGPRRLAARRRSRRASTRTPPTTSRRWSSGSARTRRARSTAGCSMCGVARSTRCAAGARTPSAAPDGWEPDALLTELLARFPDGASPPGMLAGMQSAGGRSRRCSRRLTVVDERPGRRVHARPRERQAPPPTPVRS